MTYKQLLDKFDYLERRVTMLEQGQRKQTEFPGVPTFVPAWSPHNPYQVTCKGLQ